MKRNITWLDQAYRDIRVWKFLALGAVAVATLFAVLLALLASGARG